MPRKPLREEQIAAQTVHRGHSCMPDRVEAVQPIKPRPLLPSSPSELHSPLRDSRPGLVAEQRRVRVERLPPLFLELPKPPQLDH